MVTTCTDDPIDQWAWPFARTRRRLARTPTVQRETPLRVNAAAIDLLRAAARPEMRAKLLDFPSHAHGGVGAENERIV